MRLARPDVERCWVTRLSSLENAGQQPREGIFRTIHMSLSSLENPKPHPLHLAEEDLSNCNGHAAFDLLAVLRIPSLLPSRPQHSPAFETIVNALRYYVWACSTAAIRRQLRLNILHLWHFLTGAACGPTQQMQDCEMVGGFGCQTALKQFVN